ncbi:EamA family transporter RarD [Allomesorhizobium camelthorni]|uniref:EamA family transporter RarD n=1 Tax=Allomesorhizobium camelthorni TaxID=475069 RepID=A0A6G4WHB5_9HYPH|nr:EamA family transporter RarD [Mesorhizobium camelthorni]NGO53989.1 EamA family transporter RarD [Mesorhizobium camelthorni]
MTTETLTARDSATRGFLFGLSAYLLWGFLPFYMKAVAHIPAAEVVAHRVIWSVPVAGALLIWMGRTADIKLALRSPRTLAMGGLTAALITVNWGVYVWAIAADRALETALGYYINPLFSVFLGAVLLGEKLSRAQIAAIALAVAAVALLTWEAGGLPWVSIALALSWGFYAFFKKTLPIGPAQGFFLEILVLSIPAIGYIGWLGASGAGHFGRTGAADIWLLLGCGLVTAVPLILYANGAKLLRLSTIGIMQYIAPTMIFVIAIFIFHEPFSSTRAIAFAMIWTALAIYSWSMFFRRTETAS